MSQKILKEDKQGNLHINFDNGFYSLLKVKYIHFYEDFNFLAWCPYKSIKNVGFLLPIVNFENVLVYFQNFFVDTRAL